MEAFSHPASTRWERQSLEIGLFCRRHLQAQLPSILITTQDESLNSFPDLGLLSAERLLDFAFLSRIPFDMISSSVALPPASGNVERFAPPFVPASILQNV